MTPRDLARQRLIHQRIDRPAHASPGELVAALGAIQAQDFLGSLWAIGLRLVGRHTEASVEAAISNRTIVRTWALRGTLHFVAAADLRWLLALLAPRTIASAAGRRRELELDAPIFVRSEKIVRTALEGGRSLDRDGIYRLLEGARIATHSQRGYHILWWLALHGVICGAARAGKQPTFALLDEWLPAAAGPAPARDTSLAELAARYFAGHGPATERDFAGWAGLPLTDARAGLAAIAPRLQCVAAGGQDYWLSPTTTDQKPTAGAVYLLPGFDEFYLGYRDRTAIVASEFAHLIAPGGNGLIRPVIVADGSIVGTWKRTLGPRTVAIAPTPFAPLNPPRRRALEAAAARYRRFLGCGGSQSAQPGSSDGAKP